MYQHCSQVLIAALADAHQDLSVAAGMLRWDVTHPGSQVPAILEFGTVADGRDHGRRCFGTNAADAHDALTGSTGPENRLNAAVECIDPVKTCSCYNGESSDECDDGRQHQTLDGDVAPWI